MTVAAVPFNQTAAAMRRAMGKIRDPSQRVLPGSSHPDVLTQPE
jgi:hypothetical protein